VGWGWGGGWGIGCEGSVLVITHYILSPLGLPRLARPLRSDSLQVWWPVDRDCLPVHLRKGFDSLVLLVSCSFGKSGTLGFSILSFAGLDGSPVHSLGGSSLVSRWSCLLWEPFGRLGGSSATPSRTIRKTIFHGVTL
jgi:hypothetical protein